MWNPPFPIPSSELRKGVHQSLNSTDLVVPFLHYSDKSKFGQKQFEGTFRTAAGWIWHQVSLD